MSKERNNRGEEIALSYHDCLLRNQDVDLLRGAHWINDALIGFYFEYLQHKNDDGEESQEILFISPELTQLLKLTDPAEYSVFLEPLNAKQYSYILFPLNNCESREAAGGWHWSLLVYSKNERASFHYDSSRETNQSAAVPFSRKVMRYLSEGRASDFVEFGCPQQENGYDCGLFVLCFADLILRQEPGISWTNRMARHGSERSLHSLTMHPGQGNRAPATSPTSAESPRGFSDVAPLGCSTSNGSPVSTATTSPAGDSRIPRPSPTGLRRSASMRVRGERVVPHLRHSSASSTLSQHQQHRHFYLLKQQHQQQQLHNRHQQIDEDFPIITENGIDSHRHRSFSLSLTPARPRAGNAASSGTSYSGGSMHQIDDSDADSVKSYGSACSTASACDHAHFALNGTTWSGRSRKYVVHCSNHNGDSEQYLTPTQRAARQVRKFQNLLSEARKEIEEKDREIFRLTKEVVELRLYKASLNSPDDRTDSSDALTVRENNPFSPDSPCKDLPDESGFETSAVRSPGTPEKRGEGGGSELPASLADSGHFDDESVHSKDSSGGAALVGSSTFTVGLQGSDEPPTSRETTEEERRRLVDHYETRLEELHRLHVDELQELKEKHNDKVESLLTQLSEVNTRFCELRPSMDTAEAKVRELETELESVTAQLNEQKAIFEEQEERNKQMYLKMYSKGQEAARIEQADKIYEQASQTPPRVTIGQVLQQLNATQAELENVKAMYRRIVESRSRQGALDPEITLQFLKSAIYYFLTDKENHHGHLNAIESILGFTDNEKLNIDKIYGSARK